MKMRHTLTKLLLLGTAFFGLASNAEARRLKVLFLGHKQGMHPGHLTQDRYMDLLEGLVPKGVDLDFVETPEQALTPTKLADYDALALYANWEKITPEQEKALFDYVESGHGFVPIHSASYCFLNSMKCTQLMGARFQKHNTGEFDITTTTEGTSHPLLAGFQNFRTWDETYVHTFHNPDKIVLQRRVDASKGEDEPWTWVRNQGKGRVFYTAYGHNEKTWKQPGFHDLIFRGIKWAVGDTAAAELDKLGLKPLEYVVGAEVPNYEKRNPAPQLQKPLEPEEAQKHISVPAGMALSLFASEKDGLWNVISFKFDEKGRMWTCESLDYPNERKPQGGGRDRIRILEDSNNDGKVDKATIFAEGLSIPTSLVHADGGVIVLNLPDTTFLKDEDGDGKAEVKKVLFTGWGTSDTHACPSNLVHGIDGWIYGCVGYGGFKGNVGGKDLAFGQGIYRFKKDGSVLEFMGRTSNNTWGFGFDENGDVFGSTANGQSSFYCPIPARYYEATPGMSQGILPGIDSNKRAPIGREYIRQVDWFGGFTAAACHQFYTARSFPQEYWNQTAFVAEPTCHILYQGVRQQNGTQFVMNNGMDLMNSDDEWFAPVHAEVGPDGSLYVSDFYSFLIQHNPTPSVERGGFKATTGIGNAFMSNLRDTERARLWKVTYTHGKPSATFSLSKDSPDTLVKALESDNQLWRNHASRLLIERGKQDVVAKLKTLAADQKVDTVGISGGAYTALWTLAGLNALDATTLDAAMKHPAEGVRRTAIMLQPRTDAGRDGLASSGALQDKSPLVKLTTLLTLSEMPPSGTLGNQLYKLGEEDESMAKDEWLPTAHTIAAARHAIGYLGAALAAGKPQEAALSPGEPKTVESKNLLKNADFEDAPEGKVAGWAVRTYGGEAKHEVDTTVFKKSKQSLRISSTTGADSSYFLDVKVEPNTDYLWTGWIKTQDLSTTANGKGAMLEIHQLNGEQPHTTPIKGNTDWTKVALSFNSGKQSKVSLNLLYGGWGPATGTMWIDDVRLVSVSNAKGSSAVAKVAAAFAAKASPEAKAALAKVAAANPGETAESIMKVLSASGDLPKIETLDELAKTHQILKLKTISGNMKYSAAELKAKAGKPIAIEFINMDALQHNVIVGTPNSFEKLNAGAMKMMSAADGLAKGWVPETPDVLAKCLMLDMNQVSILKLPALKPGSYPYLCTFPSHSAIMKGTLNVEP